MLLTFQGGTGGGMCNAIHRYAKANNKYMKNYNKNVELSFIEYLDANNLYGWAMSKKLPIAEFEWICPEDYTENKKIKKYDESDDYGAILEVDVDYPKHLHKLHSNLPFLPERMKISKVDKRICNLQNKRNYVVHVAALKQALDQGLILKKVHRVIKFKQEAWLKPYIDMNTDLRKKAKNEFEKDFFKLMNNSVFGKTMENVRNHRDIKIVTTNKQRKKFASEPNYRTTKYISKDLLIMEMKKLEVKMNKPIYLGQAILDVDNVRLCYTDTDSFVIHVKTEDFYKDIADDVGKWFDTSKYDKDDNRPLPIGKNKKAIGKFKDELDGKIIIEVVALRAKAYAFLVDCYDDGDYDKNKIINKKSKGTNKCIIKRELTCKNYKDSLLNNEIVTISQHRFRRDHHKVYTEEVNKIARSSNDDKRIQKFDTITTYPYGTNAFKVCEMKC